MSWFQSQAPAASSGFDLSLLIRSLEVLVFALIQLMLLAWILVDLGGHSA